MCFLWKKNSLTPESKKICPLSLVCRSSQLLFRWRLFLVMRLVSGPLSTRHWKWNTCTAEQLLLSPLLIRTQSTLDRGKKEQGHTLTSYPCFVYISMFCPLHQYCRCPVQSTYKVATQTTPCTQTLCILVHLQSRYTSHFTCSRYAFYITNTVAIHPTLPAVVMLSTSPIKSLYIPLYPFSMHPTPLPKSL